MGRDVSELRPGKRDPVNTDSAGQTSVPGSSDSERVLVLDRRRGAESRKSQSGVFAASLRAREKNLARILEELDSISKTLESGPVDPQALREMLHHTILCAIKQSILDRELCCLALSDELTSLYSRRAFFAMATQQIRLMRRKGAGLLLFFADVDNLKEINDRYGHREGDLALIRVADSLRRTFRNSDIVARLGGDEFAVLAVEASGEDERGILRRLEANIRQSSARETRYSLSLSVGMARFDPKQQWLSLADLMARADEAMYEKKKMRARPSADRDRAGASIR